MGFISKMDPVNIIILIIAVLVLIGALGYIYQNGCYKTTEISYTYQTL